MTTKSIIEKSGIAFGTSGARGLVVDFTDEVTAAFSYAFLSVMKLSYSFDSVAIGMDNRPSSYGMVQACAAAAKMLGLKVLYFGVLPTPALAYSSMQMKIPCIMVTGSHIPFDRNGLKFYRPDGEISKADEKAITSSDFLFPSVSKGEVQLIESDKAKTAYISRYVDFFGERALHGKKIGIYEHSSAGRDIYRVLFENMGATVISLGRSDEFVPIDTEAVSQEDKVKAIEWANAYKFDAIFSTDGDGDRPLLADKHGQWLRGDELGLLCSQILKVDALAVPVSCSTAVELSKCATSVVRTKIGSPYVIAEFEELLKQYDTVAGFEANGGYLLATAIEHDGKVLEALPTRDALLPVLAVLTANSTLDELVERTPKRVVASDRLQSYENSKAKSLLNKLIEEPQLIEALLGLQVINIDHTDGGRFSFNNKEVVHYRPSGNAPELRCYVEADTPERAEDLLKSALEFAAQQ
ncbi:phosphomannomutase [Pseudoalteromonas sp. GCY]|uniref:phosphomannomutase n=1 Tax=Pseudoalteromonas sp. GCY TaxID=2003316 RepID=UPI000BFF0D99|nr:phosphomannomutase [Pseudoalteromonas sp. GCY]PHI34877.1 phosphomannomutase [Pseudoalteromonas sp. GCY]QQQ67761.1 phosphomannomutase [Pseudoalteromonas sp. GCY]